MSAREFFAKASPERGMNAAQITASVVTVAMTEAECFWRFRRPAGADVIDAIVLCGVGSLTTPC
jgi:hypothetical protein